MAKKPTKEQLEQFAGALRDKASVPRQAEVFEAAVTAAHVAAHADGAIDATEKAAIVQALEILSQGLVVEWEVDHLLEQAAKVKGADAQPAAIGERLKKLGEPEAALLVAAFVAQATNGIDAKETKTLKAIGKAAGISDKRVREILKDVGSESPES